MRRVSPDGEMGFPGDLDVTVSYRVEDADLVVEYVATTTAPTVVNLTNHTYFNLAGGGSVEDHVVRIEADAILPIDERSIPTGERLPVDGTLRSTCADGTPIGVGLRAGHEQLVRAHGYDHTYVRRRIEPRRGWRCTSTNRRRDARSSCGPTAGSPVLHRQLPRRQRARPGRGDVPAIRCVLPGAAALP
jgi:galactose mutarotase-like enzyme